MISLNKPFSNKFIYTDVDELVAQKDQFQPDVKSVGSSSHTVESANNVDDQFSTGSIENIQKKKESGSILEILEEMISVGQTMGFSMEGSIKDMERIIDLKGADDLETKAEKVSDMEIKSLWGNTNFDAIVSQSLANQTRMLIVSVYAPQAVSLKRTLWSYLSSLINRWNGECIVLGDFNEVRRKEERWGSTFNVYGARDFNHFITSAGLVEVQLEGYSYTWAHPSASKMSKLDRFLVSDGFLSLFPHTSAVCLDRHLSDHRPILLREFNTDYGATPFRLFHSWFDFQGFDDMITQTWNSINLNDSNAMVRFKKKLQALKKVIRLWIGNYKRNQMNRTTEIKIKLKDIDKLLDQLGVLRSLFCSLSAPKRIMISTPFVRWPLDVALPTSPFLSFVSFSVRDVRGGERIMHSFSRISDLLDTDVRRLLDDMLLPKSDVPSRWVKQIPIKVNVLAWKISMDRLPTRVNLHRRGELRFPLFLVLFCLWAHPSISDNLLVLLRTWQEGYARLICNWWGFGLEPLLIRIDLGYLGLIWYQLHKVQNTCWIGVVSLPGGVSGHIETIYSFSDSNLRNYW
ncbi:RNA-directed DNA polymerase, eukaryota [Tanacetum coccineum]